jgi:hypothetical protein
MIETGLNSASQLMLGDRCRVAENMTADLLKRLIRAIAEGSHPDLDSLALKIIEAERNSGHKILAESLTGLFKQAKRVRSGNSLGSGRELTGLPLSRRYSESLATVSRPESLDHYMVLPPTTEERFARIEAEYAARDRLLVHGLKPRKNILLYGPPGCGKSLGAKRLSWTLGLPLMKVRFDSLISSYFGESASNLRSVFTAASEVPCVLLLDECDFIARSRVNSKDIGEASRIVNTLLQLMEDHIAPGILVATTNVETSLDFALFRRFDDAFLIPLPGPREIEQLLHLTFASARTSPEIDWFETARCLYGESAAMVVKVARDAAKSAVLNNEMIVTEYHLRRALADRRSENALSTLE